MGATFRAKLLIAAILLPSVVVLCSLPATLTLERAFPSNHKVQLSQLRARDRVRHGRMLQQSSSPGGVINFPVEGTSNPYLVGLYFTSVKLGTPAREFYVQIDTGSDVLWVSCNSCNGCPKSTNLKIQLNSFDPQSSSTAALVSCSDKLCNLGVQSQDSSCADNQCTYDFKYGDGSGTSGYYVSDLLHFDTVGGDQSVASNSSASIVFGCSNVETGALTKSDGAVDGIFGFGQQGMSVISQLSSQGIAPKAFSHCLRGDDTGGGILVLGEIVEPNIVYSPLVQNQPHYNLNLESITVSGKTLAINASVFATSDNQGTLIDSGTTLAYLAEDAYDPFVNAITSAVSQSVTPVTYQGVQCYIVTSSITDTFPQVSLNFAGNASMILRPENYLLQGGTQGGTPEEWCIVIQKNQGQDITILGELVLKDKIIVYDLANQRIGWTQYNCSLAVNVSTNTSTGTTSVNAGLINVSSSWQNEPFKLIPISMMAFLMHISIIDIFSFL